MGRFFYGGFNLARDWNISVSGYLKRSGVCNGRKGSEKNASGHAWHRYAWGSEVFVNELL